MVVEELDEEANDESAVKKIKTTDNPPPPVAKHHLKRGDVVTIAPEAKDKFEKLWGMGACERLARPGGVIHCITNEVDCTFAEKDRFANMIPLDVTDVVHHRPEEGALLILPGCACMWRVTSSTHLHLTLENEPCNRSVICRWACKGDPMDYENDVKV